MSQVMAQVLSELVNTEVSNVRLYHTSKSRYYLWVEPGHVSFWVRFKRRYPGWYEKAVELGAWCRRDLSSSPWCPEFPSIESLFRWLEEVTEFPFRVLRVLF